jgi:predicted nucleotidyltransferase
MSQQELLKKVIQALEGAGIEYMISGSLVSSLQGEPRSTHDIDVVVAIQPTTARTLVSAFLSSDYYMTEESVLEAIQHQGMFNLIDVNSGDKVDFWVLTDDPFDCSRFRRKYAEMAMGIRMIVSKPEDTILMKLKWAKLSGGSEKQYTDALRVYEVQFEKLDLDYLVHWSRKLNVESLLKKIQEEAEVL